MFDFNPGNICNMEKPIYATDIDERAKIGQALYFSSYFITFLEGFI